MGDLQDPIQWRYILTLVPYFGPYELWGYSRKNIAQKHRPDNMVGTSNQSVPLAWPLIVLHPIFLASWFLHTRMGTSSKCLVQINQHRQHIALAISSVIFSVDLWMVIPVDTLWYTNIAIGNGHL